MPLSVTLLAGALAAAPQGAPFDTGAVVRQVQRTFRASAAGFEARGGDWQVRIPESGGLRFAPAASAACEAELALGPAEVRRGLQPVPLPSRSRSDARGGLLRGEGALVEEVSTGAEGVEVRWRLAEPPRGRGDLSVRLPVTGLPALQSSPRGLHFGDGRSGVRVSHATFIDAAGRRTEIPADFRQGAIEYRVPARVLAGARYPAVLDPWISAEVSMPADGRLQPALDRYQPSVATDGTDFLVLWQDGAGYERGAVFAARVRADGTVLDPTGLRVNADARGASMPRAAWGGGVWLVVWHDDNGYDVWGRRLSAAGALLDPAPLLLVGEYSYQFDPVPAFDGTNFLVAWRDYRSGSQWDVYATRVAPSGALVDADPFRISTGPRNEHYPALACTTGLCLVAWDDDRNQTEGDIAVARVQGGTVLDPGGIVLAPGPAGQGWPSVAFDGQQFLVAWEESPALNASDIKAARVETDGGVLDPGGFDVAATGDRETGPEVSFDGANFVVFLRNDSAGRGQILRVSPQAAVLDAPARDLDNYFMKYDYAVASAPGTTLAVWMTHSASRYRLRGARYDTQLAPLEDGGFPLTLAASNQHDPAVATNGTDFLVAWYDTRDEVGDVYAARVSAAGQVLDATGIPIGAGAGPQGSPAVAWGGGNYLVAYESQSTSWDVLGRRVSAEGTVLDLNPIDLGRRPSTDEGCPAAAFDGTNFLVTWDDRRTAGAEADIYGTRVSTTGQVLDPNGLAIATGPRHQRESRIAVTDAGTFLVSWSADEGTAEPRHNLRGARVRGDGTLPDSPAGVAMTQWTFGEYYPLDQAVACGAGQCLAAFFAWGDIWATRVTGEGTPLGTQPIFVTNAPERQSEPTVVFDTDHWLVAWEDRSSRTNTELRSTRIFLDGRVEQPNGTLLLAAPTNLWHPTLSLAGPGRALLAYVRYDESPEVRAARVAVRTLFDVPRGGECGADGECQTGHCVDGVCCDTACGGGAVDCQACAKAAGAAENGTCGLLGAGKTCRPAVGPCDVAEVCSGEGLTCPEDAVQANGLVCNGTGQCASGVCVGAAAGTRGFTGTPTTFLTCSEPYRYAAAGGPAVEGPGPITFALAPRPGETLPEGLAVDAATGELSWTPTPAQAGAWKLYLVARGTGWSAAQELSIEVECAKRSASVGCAAAPGGLWSAGLLLALAGLRRRRRDGRAAVGRAALSSGGSGPRRPRR